MVILSMQIIGCKSGSLRPFFVGTLINVNLIKILFQTVFEHSPYGNHLSLGVAQSKVI